MKNEEIIFQDLFGLKVYFCNHILNLNHPYNIAQSNNQIQLSKGNLFLGGVGTYKHPIIPTYQISAALSILEKQMMVRYKINEKCEHFQILKHKWIDLLDQHDSQIYQFFEETYQFIKENLKQRNLLVHCQVGVSRSASIVIAFVMRQYNIGFHEALKLVKARRSCISPNKGFVEQLLKYQAFLLKQQKA